MKRLLGVVAAGALVALAMTGCSRTVSAPTTNRSPAPLEQPAPSYLPTLPPALTTGPPVPLSATTDNFLQPGESMRLSILRSWRHPTLETASAAVPFKAALPRYTGGTSLQYILTNYEKITASPTFPRKTASFEAIYSGGRLGIYEYPAPLYGASSQTIKVRGTNAQVGYATDTVTVIWTENGVGYAVTYQGSLDEARRIVESIPR